MLWNFYDTAVCDHWHFPILLVPKLSIALGCTLSFRFKTAPDSSAGDGLTIAWLLGQTNQSRLCLWILMVLVLTCLYFFISQQLFCFLREIFATRPRWFPVVGGLQTQTIFRPGAEEKRVMKSGSKHIITTHHYCLLLTHCDSLWPKVPNHICAHTLSDTPQTFTFLRSPPWQYSIASRGRSLVATCFCIPSGTSLAATTFTWSSLCEQRQADGSQVRP